MDVGLSSGTAGYVGTPRVQDTSSNCLSKGDAFMFHKVDTVKPLSNSKLFVCFDNGLLSFMEATDFWGLNEGTLRKAVTYGKLVDGIDVKKFGKQ